MKQKTSFQGLSLQDAKKVVFNNTLVVERISIGTNVGVNKRSRLEITARTAGAAKNIEVEVDKPLGLTLGQKQGGGVVITVSSLINLLLYLKSQCTYMQQANGANYIYIYIYIYEELYSYEPLSLLISVSYI